MVTETLVLLRLSHAIVFPSPSSSPHLHCGCRPLSRLPKAHKHYCPRQRFHIRRALNNFKEQSLAPSGGLIGLQGNPGYTYEQGTSSLAANI